MLILFTCLNFPIAFSLCLLDQIYASMFLLVYMMWCISSYIWKQIWWGILHTLTTPTSLCLGPWSKFPLQGGLPFLLNFFLWAFFWAVLALAADTLWRCLLGGLCCKISKIKLVGEVYKSQTSHPNIQKGSEHQWDMTMCRQKCLSQSTKSSFSWECESKQSKNNRSGW